ncbi:SMI1/KNR4 family protein [Actinospica durhamensis]|uniref:SMI1/KNR4 family protein n=1 Tax=Actinospica durhamensis TaxID=1508375 RepID=A0A941ER05_9ACTN|nr:SMI1/KNR4 family protein [Actinospica durhamensis]MBR7834907.1 SMI1/KNR4 family protein [Actinospica durhamensis]
MTDLTDDELIELVRAELGAVDPVPATLEQVEEAERVLGFRIPPLLRRLYLEVANGWLAKKSGGVIGVPGGHRVADVFDITEMYRDGAEPTGTVPPGVVVIYDWGCAILSLVDFRDPAGPMWAIDNGRYFRDDMDVKEWLHRAVAGTLAMPSPDGRPDVVDIPQD